MTTLAICILSHERPDKLNQLLSLLTSTIHQSRRVSIYIFDNSILCANAIKSLSLEYGIPLVAKPGESQASNYASVLSIKPHTYVMIMHDDDCLYVSDLSLLLDDLSSLHHDEQAAYVPALVFDNSYHFSKHTVASDLYPIENNLQPFKLPVFPSWIFRMDFHFTSLFRSYFLDRPAGKYSDIVFIHHLVLKSRKLYSPKKIAGCIYLYREHESNDSKTSNLKDHFAMYYCIGVHLRPAYFFRFTAEYLLNVISAILNFMK